MFEPDAAKINFDSTILGFKSGFSLSYLWCGNIYDLKDYK